MANVNLYHNCCEIVRKSTVREDLLRLVVGKHELGPRSIDFHCCPSPKGQEGHRTYCCCQGRLVVQDSLKQTGAVGQQTILETGVRHPHIIL
jgi:hypothetical protein